jgi:hypothetical protein
VLEIYRKKPNSCNLEICAQTAVPYCTDCTDFWKIVPRFYCNCTAAVRTVRTFKCALSALKNVLFCVQNKYRKNPAVPNPYRTDLLTLLAASKSVLSLCLGNRATSLLKTLLQKMETFSFFLLSLNLSISPRKNDFSFGLFPPLESLSDS